jgi:phosphoglycerate dehydrogenase-like enzyme
VALSRGPVLVVEDDRILRTVGVVLDPTTPKERFDAFADFFAHDERDFEGYCKKVRSRAPALYPAQVRLVTSANQMRLQLPGSQLLIVESLPVGREELEIGRNLVAVQKFGSRPRNIDTRACASRGVEVLTIRRYANIACAESVFMMMLTLAKKTHRLMNRISSDQLARVGYSYKPFDRRHTPNSNWARIPGVRMLNEATLGIIGMGEIGREIAIRAAAFGMRVLYFQRTRLSAQEEQELQATYAPLSQLLGESDWVVPQLPESPSTKGLIDRTRFAQMKTGACLVNVSRAEVVDRTALIAALKSGRLAGFALDPLYESPGNSADELLKFENVVMLPHIAAQPRANTLNDVACIIENLSKVLEERKKRR